ncbi:MAG: hypothetical protein ACK583_12010 [Cyanobacteriota bacterium]
MVVAGVAEFRPSGRVQQIGISQIQPAHGDDELFSEAPKAWGSTPVFTPAVQGPGSGVATLFGTRPGDETDAELITALAAIR